MTIKSFRTLSTERAIIELHDLRNSQAFKYSKSTVDSPGFQVRVNSVDIGFEVYAEIRNKVEEVLKVEPRKSKTIQKDIFDKELILAWNDIFAKVKPYDSAFGGMWAYITLRVLYDFAIMRFPDNADERYLGKNRNVFWRLHQRVEILGPDLAAQLMEDEAVQIMERADLLGRNKNIGRALAQTIVNKRESDITKSELTNAVRETAKEILRSLTVLSYSAIPQKDIMTMVERIFDENVEKGRKITNVKY